MEGILINFTTILVWILIIAIFIRVILSWIPMGGSQFSPLVAIIYQITEPVLAPLRRIIPRFGMFDFTPTVALIILFAIAQLL